jgi:hypothetical protein
MGEKASSRPIIELPPFFQGDFLSTGHFPGIVPERLPDRNSSQ